MPRKLSKEEIEERVKAIDPRVSIDFSTFSGYSKRCRFIDSELGEFWTKPVWLCSQRSGHPARSEEKKAKTTQAKYGSAHYMQSEKGREEARSRWHNGLSEKAKEGRTANGFNGLKDPAVYQKALQTMHERYGSEKEAKRPKKVANIKYRVDGQHSLRATAAEQNIPYSTLQQWCQRGCAPEEALDAWSSNISALERFCEERFNWFRLDKKALKNASFRPDFQINDVLFVDVDGLFWHCEHKKGRTYHFDKRVSYEQEKKRLLQFYSSEVSERPHVVESIVQAKAGALARKIYARKCTISYTRCSDFFHKNHLMGERRGTVHVFLQYEGENVFGISYTVSGKQVEIQRCASKIGVNVVGGLSKILSEIQKQTEGVEKFISWVDLRYADGKGFEACGFVPVREHISWRWTDSYTTFNRRWLMASNGISEKERANQEGLVKIYDAGQRLLEKYV